MVYIPQGPYRPVMLHNYFARGPVRIYFRFEFILFDCLYVRIDYYGAWEMWNIPRYARRDTGAPLDWVSIVWTPFALNEEWLC